LADQALNIAARKLHEGEQVAHLSAYCLAVARKLVIEQARERKKKQAALSDQGRSPAAALNPDRQRLLEILDQCIAELPAPERRLLLAYYGAEKQAKIEARKALADEMGIALNAVRIRAWRLRSKLEQAVNRRLEVLPRK
jgi:DNA-directed RNA polymerase specialized sigma24 family protein